jgi:hypothetical protein
MSLIDLFKPKWKSSKSDKREEWIKESNPEIQKHSNILVKIAINDEDYSVSTFAAEKLTEQNILADVAKYSKKSDVRIIAIQKLIDQDILIYIAKNDENDHVREAATKKITNQDVLTKLVLNDKSDIVRKVAAEKITKIECIINLCNNISDFEINTIVFNKIENEKQFNEITKSVFKNGNTTTQLPAKALLYLFNSIETEADHLDFIQYIDNVFREHALHNLYCKCGWPVAREFRDGSYFYIPDFTKSKEKNYLDNGWPASYSKYYCLKCGSFLGDDNNNLSVIPKTLRNKSKRENIS